MPTSFERWKPHIDAAASEEVLVATIRQYCATWLPSDLAKLPPHTPACDVQGADDIPAFAVLLTAAELKCPHDCAGRAALLEMTHTFRAAADKLKRLRRH